MGEIMQVRAFLALFILATTISAAIADDKLPPGVIKSDAGFYHPGILVNRPQLEFIKAKVAAGAEPWKSAFEAAKSSDFGSRDYAPKPRATVECGPFSKPDLG